VPLPAVTAIASDGCKAARRRVLGRARARQPDHSLRPFLTCFSPPETGRYYRKEH